MALLFLAGAALSGVALVRRTLRGLLTRAEEWLWGVVTGWMLTTLAGYLLARLNGELTFALAFVLTIFTTLATILFWLPTLALLCRRFREREPFSSRPRDAGLLFVLVIFAPIYAHLFSVRMLLAGDGGIYSGGSTQYDLPWHLAISTSFLYGGNFPPAYTPFPPAPLLYPFLPDFQTALLVALGMTLRHALILTGVALSLVLTGIFYTFARRIIGYTQRASEARTQMSAALATILFLLNGGFGFVYFFRDWRASGRGFVEFWSRMSLNYANLPAEQISWTNIIADTLLPQRTSLYGLPLALIIFSLFAIAWREWTSDKTKLQSKVITKSEAGSVSNNEEDGALKIETRGVTIRRAASVRVLLFAGALAGLLPLFHTHTYLAVGLVSVFLFALRPRRAWLAFWTPAVLLALPHFASLAGHVAAGAPGFIHFQLGWRSHSASNPPLYWLKNIGLPLLLVVPAWASLPSAWRRFYLAFVTLFIVSLLVIFTPNDYDNIKLMFYWHAVSCVLVAAWLVRVARIRRIRLLSFGFRLLAACLALISIATGVLTLQHESAERALVFNDAEIAAARFVREHTAPRALFLTAPIVQQPILSLAGRAVLRGDTAWLWSHGYDYAQREADVKRIYAGGDDAIDLLRYYAIDFVYLGRAERDTLNADASFFDARFPVFFRDTGVIIYDTRQHMTTATGATEIVARAASENVARDAATGLPIFAPREFASRLDVDPAQLLVEFPHAGYAVYRYRKVLTGRMPQYRELMDDMRAAGRGVFVGAQGWEEVLEQNKRALAASLVASDDFNARYAQMSNENYVDALYANAGVTLAPAGERADLIAQLGSGRESRAFALRRIAESRQLYRQDYNAAFLLMHYFAYLRRGPADAPDKNLDGFNYWLADLNRTGDYRSLSRVFLESGEYKNRRQ